MSEHTALASAQREKLDNTGPSFSFIIEWDNARISEVGRARQMLKALQEQVIAHQPRPALPPQIVILYDKRRIDPAIIHQILAETIDPKAWDATIQVVPTDGLGYYQLKNHGVPQTDREIVVFLDSDVIPEPGWFDAMMSAIENPEVDIVSGNTYVMPDTFYAKAFHLFWFFELRSKQARLYEHGSFYANNIAFKRPILERYPYPDLESFRGQCVILCDRMKKEGVRIYRHDGARVSHPPPNGFEHFYRRAICEGHDEVMLQRAKRMGRLLSGPIGSTMRFWKSVKKTFQRAVRCRHDVNLSVLGAAGAVLLGIVYYVLKLFGEVVTFFNPGIVRRYWPI